MVSQVRAPLGHQKHIKTAIPSSRIKVFSFSTKVSLGIGLGAFSGRILEPKLKPRGTKLGPCGHKSPRKQQQKLSKKSPSSQVASGKLETAEMMAGDGEGERCFEAIF